MSFTPYCPKCEGTSGLRVERDQYSTAGGSDNSILRCRCGFFLFGKGAIDNLLAAQHTQYLTEIASVAPPPQQKSANAPTKKPDLVVLKTSSEEELTDCAWAFCTKGPDGVPSQRRTKSKYCSRDCSNRNARHRWKAKNNTAA